MFHWFVKKTMVVWPLMAVLVVAGAGLAGASSLSQFMLTADDPIEGAEFGRSMAVHGPLVVVGAPEGSDGTDAGPGAVYVFRRSGGIYVQEAKLVAPDPEDGAEFGRAVAVSRNIVVVGARFASNGISQRTGAAYIYMKNRGRWVFVQKVVAEDGAPEDNFGRAIALGKYRLVISSRTMDVAGENVGAVYVFRRVGRETWRQEAVLAASDGTDQARFGQSVAVQRNLIAVGARDADTDVAEKAGAVYLFQWARDRWVETDKLIADDGRKGDQFGFNIDIAGRLIAVGARRADPDGVKDAGAVYLYAPWYRAWGEVGKLTAIDGSEGDEFGHSVAMWRGQIAVGARRADIDERENQGAVYLFRGYGEWWEEFDKLTAYNGEAGDEFGHSMDFYGGIVAVGANIADFDAVDQGTAYLFREHR